MIRSVFGPLLGAAIAVAAAALLFYPAFRLEWFSLDGGVALLLSWIWLIGAAVAAGYVAGIVAGRAPMVHALATAGLLVGVNILLAWLRGYFSVAVTEAMLMVGCPLLGGLIVRRRSPEGGSQHPGGQNAPETLQ